MRPAAVRTARRSYKVAARTRQRVRSSANGMAPAMSASAAAMRSSSGLLPGAGGSCGSTASNARAAQIEVGIAPGVELGRATQGLSGAGIAGAFSGMMDDEHGDAIATLQLAQIGEQRSDLAAGVLVDAVQADEGIEDEQAWLQSGHGVGEAVAIVIEIEAEGGRGDDLDVEIGERDAGGLADAIEAAFDDVQRVLGGVD